MKRIVFICLMLPVLGFSQTRNESWSRINFSYTINSRWTTEADFQYRTQSNFKTEDKNIFHYSLGYSGRLWIHYQLHKNWKLIISPVSYFTSSGIPGENNATGKRNDIRVMTGISKTVIKKNWSNKNRFLYEVGFIDFTGNTNHIQTRYRLLNSFTFPFQTNNFLRNSGYYFANELFFQTSNKKTSFDQNRIYNAILWKNDNAEATAGYQWIVQKDKSFFFRNQLLITLRLSIANKHKQELL